MAKILEPAIEPANNIEAPVVPTYVPGEDLSRLEEMYEAMQGSIDNANNVIAQQHLLIEVLEKSDKAEQFKDFIESLNAQTADICSQVEVLTGRRTHFEIIKAWVAENPEKNDGILHSFIEFLGVFSRR